MEDLYEILGVSPTSEIEVITAAYKAMMRKYHPDTNKSASAVNKAQEINEAYEVLKSPLQRREYDAKRSQSRSQGKVPTPPSPPPPPPSPPAVVENAWVKPFLVTGALIAGVVWLTSQSSTNSAAPGNVSVAASEVAISEVATSEEATSDAAVAGNIDNAQEKYERPIVADEADMVQNAEKRENIKTCMDGRYPSLCNHEALSNADAADVLSAEKRENLKVCRDGKYPSLCNHEALGNADAAGVLAAEKRENLKVCMDGRYPSLCNHSLLE